MDTNQANDQASSCRATPTLPRHMGLFEVRSQRQNSETQIAALIAITVHGPTPPKGGALRQQSGDDSTPEPYYAHQGSENVLTYLAASHPRTHGASRCCQ
ncbi:hypothetical protein AVEN_162226-1 [Araneus ventricosus]|uniref:Uncharacterized protein n=1 Tax=Araneus ventricosus TaxID=182803 RepID=A0A4Y2F0H8_ARAVE|nr:hypothetical protein AVEN_162226-1 [Araneus ventricosus]